MRISIAFKSTLVLAMVVASGRSLAGAQAAEATPVAVPPVIDGDLSDACWREATPISDFTQVLPVAGAAPTEATEVRFVRTNECLYIGIRCHDDRPQDIRAGELRRDGSMDCDDVIRLAFDTYGLGRDGYLFEVNPAGTRRDSLFGNDSHDSGDYDNSWDEIWQARCRIDQGGWTAEIAIPLTSVSFDPQSERWRWNCERIIRRKQEVVRWRSAVPAKDVTTIAGFDDLQRMAGFRQGLGLELRPFGRLTVDDEQGDYQAEPKFGGDAIWHLTPNLTLSATYHTDFAETEVDERVVSLSRFPTFFPEKRAFFLHDSTIYRFGGLTGSNIPFYSRRIGVSADGSPVDIIVGARFTGHLEGTTVSVLDVQQEAAHGIEQKNLGVARVTHQVSRHVTMGALVTHGDPHAPGNAWLGGVDCSYRLSDDALGGDLAANAFAMISDSARAGGSAVAFGGDLDYPNDPFDLHFYFRSYEQDFLPTLGFLDRAGVREYTLSAKYTQRPNEELLRRVSVRGFGKFLVDFSGRLVATQCYLPELICASPAGDELELEYDLLTDLVDDAFTLETGQVVTPGNYRWGVFRPQVRSSKARSIIAELFANIGGYYDGRRTDTGGSVAWRPSPHLLGSLGYEHRAIQLDGEDAQVDLAKARLDLSYDTDLTWSTFLQYDSISRDLGISSRIRWTITPGSDAFLVWNHDWLYEDTRFVERGGATTFKVGTTLRF